MDFPKKNFPYILNPHGKKREIFSDYGTYSSVDVIPDNGSFKITAQKRPSGSQVKRFFACRPTLPLHSEPTEASFPYKDKIMDELKDFRKLTQEFKHGLTIRRGKHKQGQALLKEIKTLKKRKRTEPQTPLHNVVPGLEKLVDKYKLIHNVTEVKNMNSQYTGGCLTQIPIIDDQLSVLISPCGDNFDKLQINCTEFVEDGRSITTATYSHQRSPVYEVHGRKVHNQVHVLHNNMSFEYLADATLAGFYAVRGESDVEVNVYDTNGPLSEKWDPVTVHKMEFPMETKPTSVCLSPYIGGECLVATNDGTVEMWTANSRKEEVVKEQSHRFHCSETWRQCSYGAYPRQLVLADNTAVQMFDLRMSKRDSIDLFALPCKFLHKDERVRVIQNHPVSPFFHVISTDYSLMIVDERYPNHPLLQWQHLLRTPPAYLSSLASVQEEGSHLVLIGSQSPADVCCYTFDYRHNEAPKVSEPPWRLSRMNDFTRWSEICGGIDRILTGDRLTSSLAGIAAVSSHHGFTSYQLDSHGDIFYQSYQTSSDKEGNKIYSLTPGTQDLVPDEFSISIGKDWIKNLQKQFSKLQKDASEKLLASGADITHIYDEMIIEHAAHVMCSICMGNQKNYNKDDDQGSLGNNICHSCKMSLQMGTDLTESVLKDTIAVHEDSQYDHFDDVIPKADHIAAPDTLSKIMVKLWHRDDDIKDLLIQRDKEIKQKREKKHKAVTEKLDISESIGSDDNESQALSEDDIDEQLGILSDPDQTGDVNIQSEITNNMNRNTENESHMNKSNDDFHGEHFEQDVEKQFENRDNQNLNLDYSSAVKSKGDILTVIDSPQKRKRRNSGSSLTSLFSNISSISTKSSDFPGFSTTPTRIVKDIIRNSPYKAKHRQERDNDQTFTEDSDDLHDREFLKQNLLDSFNLFSSQSPLSTSGQNQAKGQGQDSESASQRKLFSKPATNSPSKTKRKSFVSGF